MTAEKAHVHEKISFASQKLRKLSKISFVGGLGDGHSYMMTLVYVGLTQCGLVTSYGVVDIGQQIVSGNGLSHVRRQSITWTNADVLSNMNSRGQTSMNFESKYQVFLLGKLISKCRLRNGGHFVHASIV